MALNTPLSRCLSEGGLFSAPQPLTVPPARPLTVSRLVSLALNVYRTSPDQIHGLNISNNVTPLLAICTENNIEHELVVCNLMEGCVPASALCDNLLDLMRRASRREANKPGGRPASALCDNLLDLMRRASRREANKPGGSISAPFPHPSRSLSWNLPTLILIFAPAGSAQNAPEFKAMCPMHCIPVLEDGEFTMW